MLGPYYGPAGSASDEDAGSVVFPAGSVADAAVEDSFVPAGDADWESTGPASGSKYGQSAASAGNVDGYGGDDIIVGAPAYGDFSGEGTVYLFLSAGGGLNDSPTRSLTGGSQGANFGWSVAGAGDVNDDGRDDVIIGAPGYRDELIIGGPEVKVGRVFVYSGDPAGLSLDHTWSYTGTVKLGDLGYAVASAGDVNGDEIDDIVVGAPGYTDDVLGTQDREGAILVFFGSESGPSQEPDWVIDSDQTNARLGMAVSAAGDVNDDGYDDLIAGAPFYLNPETDVREGAAFLFLGGASPPASAAWVTYGECEGAEYGAAVAGVGDVNGDDHPDVVVSAPQYLRSSDDARVGAAFAFCGNGSLLGSSPCWTVLGDQPGAIFGTSAGAAGDVNADGYDDVIVGAPLYLNDLPDETRPEGAAFLYHGSETGLSAWAGWKARGDKSRTDFGYAVGTAGNVSDVASDGVIVGAPQYFKETDPWGAAFVFYGPIEPAPVQRTFLPLIVRYSN